MTSQDAIDLLIHDHRTVDGLFEEYETLDGGTDARKRDLVDQMIQELSIHAAIEEQLLYPFIRNEVPGGGTLADEGLHEHQEAKGLLDNLERMQPGESGFDQTVKTLINAIRHHVEEEETEFFPALRQAATPDQLMALGARLAAAKKVAPTHPHPKAPDTPPGNIVAGAAAAVVDKVRDALKRD